LEKDDFLDSLGKVQSLAIKKFIEILNRFRKTFEVPGDLYLKVKNFLSEIDYLEGLGRMYKPRADAEARYENVLELLHSINEMDKKHDRKMMLGDFLHRVALAEEYANKKEEETEEDRNTVTLLTVHAAKGLEFPFVFLVGLEQNLFPHERSLKERSLPEERRLFYVAMTRAKKELVLSWCFKRKIRQNQLLRKKSQFLAELPEDNFEEIVLKDLLQQISNGDISSRLRLLRDSF
jgi:superfamily I DNA/RNA helicase